MTKIKENEKKFLNKLYDEMLLSGFLTASDDIKNRDDKIKAVTDYLDRLKKVHDKAIDRVSGLELLKSFYRRKYIIKEEDIPDSYYDMQVRIDFERGLGNKKLTNARKKELATSVITDQTKSLDIWLDYLFSKDASFYPYQLKYWAFQGMLKMGSYDKVKKEFTRRSKNTVNRFIELDIEALALTINEMDNYLKHQELSDDELSKMLANSSFSKLYTYFYNKLSTTKKDDTNSDEGIWIKYEQGNNYKPLVKSLEGMGTGWCTAGETTAKMQLEDGDFYVYYTKDKNGEFKIPRLAIRMDGNSIEEIRGVAKEQNIESNMERVLEEKLKEFSDRDAYKKKVNDMKQMTIIYDKYKKNIELTKDELIFLYEVDVIIDGFGYDEDPRIEEVKSNRNLKKDLSFIFNCKEDEITDSWNELIENPNKFICFFGDIKTKLKKVNFPKLRYIIGNADFGSLTTAEGLNALQKIRGYANFEGLRNPLGLNNLKIIGGYAYFINLTTSDGLNNLQTIGGSAHFRNLTSAQGLNNLQSIGGNALFDKLTSAQGLNNLKTIGIYAQFDSLTSALGLNNLKIIGDDAYFHSLTTIEGLSNKLQIKGVGYFDSLLNTSEKDRFKKR